MKKLCLFVLSMAVASLAFCQMMEYQAQKPKSTGLPYVPVKLANDTSVYMSPTAANAYVKDSTIVNKLVPGTIQGKQVLMLPSEQVKTPVAKQDSVSRSADSLERAIEQQIGCGGNQDCVYLKMLWKARGISDNQIPGLISEARSDFAQKLRLEKKLCYNISVCINAMRKVELGQVKQALGAGNSMRSLDQFVFTQPELTLKGWENALMYLCQQGKKNATFVKDIKKFAKKTEKEFDSKKLPIVTPSNVDPYAGSLGAGLACIERL